MTKERMAEIHRLFNNRAYHSGGIYQMEGGIIWECLGEIEKLQAALKESVIRTKDLFDRHERPTYSNPFSADADLNLILASAEAALKD